MEHEGLAPFQLLPADNVAIRWERWLARLDNFLVAKNITVDKRQKAMLLHYAGESVFEISEAVGVLTTHSFAETKEKLGEYFAPKRNVEYEIFQFRNARQLESETLDQFQARLQQLAKYCEFSDRDREIKSQIIQRCLLQKVREKGLTETKWDLDKLVSYGRTLEATNTQSQAIAAGTSATSAPATKVHQVKSKGGKRQQQQHRQKAKQQPQAAATGNGPKSPCPGCGGGPHDRRKCKAWGKECHKCKKFNHFASVCRAGAHPKQSTNVVSSDYVQSGSQPDPIVPNPVNYYPIVPNSVNYSNVYSSEANSGFKVYSVLSGTESQIHNVAPYMCEVRICGEIVYMEIDTGASSTLINESTFRKICSTSRIKPVLTADAPNLRTYSGEALKPLGRAQVPVVYGEQKLQLSVVVVPGKGPNLLGRDWLEKLRLDWPRVHQLRSEDISKQFPDLFREGTGCLKNVEAKLHIDANAVPRCCKPRVVPYAIRDKVEKELARLEKEGTITPVEFSEWAAPIVPVLKPNGGVRICGDYKQTINSAAKVDKYPLPHISDLYTKLCGGQYYSNIDLSNAYQQVRLDKASQELTTITTQKGLFAYTRLCFGVSSAPGIFQRIMEQVLQGIPMVAVYLDDILVSGHTYEEAKDNLLTVLRRLQDAGLTLKAQKCSFLQKSVVYLGHILSAEGIRPTEEKVRVVLDAPEPTNVPELRSFLGMVNHYHQFLPNASAFLAPLHELLQKDVKWHWGKEQQNAFDHAKSLLRSPNVLVHYNPSLPLIVTCDASPYGIGAVLAHRMPDGTERPIAFASRTLIPAEKNYAQIEREGLAVVFAVTRFHKYLYGREFTIVTDHKPLLGLLGESKAISTTASSRVQRWALLLMNYMYQLRYKPGPQIPHADGLSRLPVAEPATKAPIPEETVLLMSTLESTPLTAQQIAQWTARDPILSMVLRFVLQGWPTVAGEELAPYFRRRDELTTHQGCLLWGSRLIIPTPGRETLLEDLHDCHPGMVRMKSVARSYFWWPRLDDEIEAKVRSCQTCQEISKAPPKSMLHPWEWPGKPWYRLHIDYAGPFEGKMILVIVDAHTKYIDAHVVSSATSENTVLKLRQTFATHGLPVQITSDNGTCFTSAVFGDFCRINGIKHICTAPYHPASNGQAERAVQTIKAGLRKTTEGDLETRLFRVLAQYRMTPHAVTGQSPSELLMGRRPRTRFDLLVPNLADRVLSKQSKMKDIHDPRVAQTQFYCGDSVWALNMAGTPKWLPGVLEDRTGPVSFTVRLTDNRLWRRHSDHLRPRFPHETPPAEAPTPEAPTPLPTPMVPEALTPLPTFGAMPSTQTPMSGAIPSTQTPSPTPSKPVALPKPTTSVPPPASHHETRPPPKPKPIMLPTRVSLRTPKPVIKLNL